MSDCDKEIVEVLRDIKKQLESIQYDLADIKREMPKVPYYGDLLQDIEKAVRDIKLEWPEK